MLAEVAWEPSLCYKGDSVPRISAQTSSRCRLCGEPLVGKGRRSVCPRCHPQDVADDSQLEFSLNPANALPEPLPLPEESAEVSQLTAEEAVYEAEAAEAESQLAERAQSSNPLDLPRAPRSISRWLAIILGALIVTAGVGWVGFQMWPRGPVERSIVQAFEALPHFTERTGEANPFHGLSVAAESTPTFGDLNGDGLLDFITGSQSGEFRVYLNAGTRRRPCFVRPTDIARGLVPTDTSNAVTFANLRGVGLLDALNAGTNGAPTYFANRGRPQHPDFLLISPEQDPFAVTVPPSGSADWRPVFADIDHDRDFDLFVGTRDGTVLFCENRGTANRPQFHGVTRVAPFGLHGLGPLVSLAFGDLDGDRDLDAIAGNAAGELHFLENRGNAWRPEFHVTPPGSLGLTAVGREATVALADLDGDADLDLVTGSADGHFRYFENLITATPSVPASPTPASPAPPSK